MSQPQSNQASADQQTPGRARSLWHNRDYLLLWSGQMVSLIGSGASQLAFPLLILALTGSPAQAGFAGALRGIPYIMLSLPAGALIDRWDRQRVMILCDLGRTLAMGSIPIAYVLGHLTVVQLYIAALLEGILFTFFNLAETACIPNVVEREQIVAAAAQNEVTFNFTFLLGPYLGGILYNTGKVLPFLADAISYSNSPGPLGTCQTSSNPVK